MGSVKTFSVNYNLECRLFYAFYAVFDLWNDFGMSYWTVRSVWRVPVKNSSDYFCMVVDGPLGNSIETINSQLNWETTSIQDNVRYLFLIFTARSSCHKDYRRKYSLQYVSEKELPLPFGIASQIMLCHEDIPYSYNGAFHNTSEKIPIPDISSSWKRRDMP